MTQEFDAKLDAYAELIVKVGLNVQPGQRLLIGRGTPFEARRLVHHIARHAYAVGAELVDVMWGDEELARLRLDHGPAGSFDVVPRWPVAASLEYAERGDALLAIVGSNPDLMAGVNESDLSALMAATVRASRPASEYVSRSAINWSLAAVPVQGWAARIFPDLPAEEQMSRMWETIFAMCRLNVDDPLAGWQAHIADLTARSTFLNEQQYDALHLRAAGTDLTIGLPKGHVWMAARMRAENGIDFTANIPTEEVFTLPDRTRVDGVVRSTKPLFYGGALIEDFSLTFADGKVVKAEAKRGESVLTSLLETDEGAPRLGEIALVPHSSPISQSNLLFYNTLFDENASCHIALGRAYRFTLEDGRTMDEDGFVAAGGNSSAIHVDFMIGAADMDIDALGADGARAPLMRQGEWAA